MRRTILGEFRPFTEDLGYVDPHLVLTKDCEDPVHYRMEFTGQTPKVNTSR